MTIAAVNNASFYTLFSKHNATFLLHLEGRTASSALDKARELIKEQKQFAGTKITFNEKKCHETWSLTKKDKDFFSVNTFEDCYRVRVLSDKEFEVILYCGDFEGKPKPSSLFNSAPAISSCFTVKDTTGKLIPKVFDNLLPYLARHLVNRGQEIAYKRRVQDRQKFVLSELKQGEYNAEVGIQLF